MWKDNGIVAFYNDSKSDLDSRLKSYEEIVQTDEKQATEFQKTYHDFEKIYFKKLSDVVKGVQGETANSQGVKME